MKHALPLLFASLLATPFLMATEKTFPKEPLDIGAKAPLIEAINQDGKTVSLPELYKTGTVLVFFYPKADTPGCTAQACSLRDEFATLTEKGITVVGVSMDSVEAQKKFQEKYNLPYTLLADKEAKVVRSFGVPRRAFLFAARQAFLIHNGEIVWRDLSASTAQQAVDVLAAIETVQR